MNISDLLTVLTILLAVYAILPKTKILDIKLRLTALDWLIIWLTLLLLLYLQFYNVFASIGLTPKYNLSRYNLNPNNFSFIVVLLLSLYLLLKTHLVPLAACKLDDLKNLFEQLSYEEELGQMVCLLDKHFSKLVKLYTKNKSATEYNVGLLSDEELINKLNASLTSSTPKPSKLKTLLHNFKQNLNDRTSKRHETRRNIISDIFKLSLSNPRFVYELSKTNPYLALKILDAEIDIWLKREFCECYLKELLSTPTSILYSELNNNQETTSEARYKIPESNRLLYFLFADARKAEDIYVWKPVGEKIIGFLVELQRNPDKDDYNLPYDRLYEEELLPKCPIKNTILFFDIMVTEAIYQNIKWHMWLYYFEHITDHIVKNFNLDNPHVDKEAEFPNRYSYLLYEMRYTLCRWISILNYLPADQENIQLDDSALRGNTANIIQSSILALGHCIYTVSSSTNIPESFKKYLIEGIFSLYFDIRIWSRVNQKYADLLLESLLKGGQQFYKKDEDYNSLVLDTLLHIDTIPLVFDNFKDCLKKVVKHFVGNYGEYDSKYILLKRLDANTLQVKSRLLYQDRFERCYKIDSPYQAGICG